MTDRTWRGRVFIGVSLDGFIARPDGDIDWLTDPPDLGRHHQAERSSATALDWDTFYPTVDHLVMGRGTYEKVLTFGEWPYTDKTVIVLSTNLAATDERIRIARSLPEARQLLEAGGAEQVYIDGGRVIQSFVAAGLVDEITVAVAPVLIGSGLPLFGELNHDVHLELRATHATETGMVSTTYDVTRETGEARSSR